MNVHFKEHALLACNPFITNCQRALHFYPLPTNPWPNPVVLAKISPSDNGPDKDYKDQHDGTKKNGFDGGR